MQFAQRGTVVQIAFGIMVLNLKYHTFFCAYKYNRFKFYKYKGSRKDGFKELKSETIQEAIKIGQTITYRGSKYVQDLYGENLKTLWEQDKGGLMKALSCQ